MRIHQIEVSNVLKIKDVTAKFDPSRIRIIGGEDPGIVRYRGLHGSGFAGDAYSGWVTVG